MTTLARFGAVPQFTLTSADLIDGAPLGAAQFAVDAGGSGQSPQLSWSGFPPETRSFAITVYDPDAPTGSGFWHWAVCNLPATVTSLKADAGAPGSGALPAEALVLPNETRQADFAGAAPPEGTGTHRYQFIVHAVDVPVFAIEAQSTPAVLGFNLHFHTLARAVLEGTGAFGGTH